MWREEIIGLLYNVSQMVAYNVSQMVARGLGTVLG